MSGVRIASPAPLSQWSNRNPDRLPTLSASLYRVLLDAPLKASPILMAPAMTSRLYDLADQFLRLAPWTWMNEEQLIGLQHPDTNEIAWISIMGAGGNHRTLALYLGQI